MSDLRIEETKDYDKFSFIESNRDQEHGHVKNLIKAFEQYGNLTKVQPILVNEKFQIIDGQHRFMAAKELEASIYYTVAPGLGVAEARSMNILHKNWRMLDYAKSYANEGDGNYQRFMWLIKEFAFSPSVTLVYSIGHEGKGIFKQFREGEFSFPEENYEEAKERLSKLDEISKVIPSAKADTFNRALLHAMKVPGYSHVHMLRKLQLHQNLIERKATVQDALRMLEEVYNHQLSEARRIRLY